MNDCYRVSLSYRAIKFLELAAKIHKRVKTVQSGICFGQVTERLTVVNLEDLDPYRARLRYQRNPVLVDEDYALSDGRCLGARQNQVDEAVDQFER